MDRRWIRFVGAMGVVFGTFASQAQPAQALDQLCDPGGEDCRAILISYIRAEQVGIDVGFWFMEDARFSTELIRRHNAGVRVRVLMDPRANATNLHNAQRLAELQTAGIPMRNRTATGILHYKMMLFSGQNVLEFSGANYSADAFTFAGAPYSDYTDESIYFTDDLAIVNSFRSKFDDLWTNTTNYADYANITLPPVRVYDLFPKAPELNFAPGESYATRAVGRYNRETQKIDVIMYRITDRKHTDAIVAARNRGVAVRLITEPKQYRDPVRLWHSWNVDRLYMAGVQIKDRAHAGLNHQKSVLLYGLGMTIFGSSNWTTASANSQEEHNYFTTKPALFQWFVDQFERKWNNTGGVVENIDFVPLPPDKPDYRAPSNGALNVDTTSVQLTWYAGLWAHKYDVYLGADPANLPRVLIDTELGPNAVLTGSHTFTATNLNPGTPYYWRVVSRTMANQSRTGDLWSFTTAGVTPPPPPTTTNGPGDIVVHGLGGLITGTTWAIASDPSAAGAKRLWNMNAGASKLSAAQMTPANYVDFTFSAVAGQPYRLWIRGKAESNHYLNDSVFVQFSNAVTSAGVPTHRVGTTSAAAVNLEDCGGCGLAGWGWQDNGWGIGVMGPVLYFDTTGPQTLRVQAREDGLSIDQILLSPSLYLNASPGALKNDATIFAATGGG